jgi:hypothetical protein
MRAHNSVVGPVVTAGLLLAGCAVATDQAVEVNRFTASSIVGGTTSTTEQDAVVKLVNGDEFCSGSLIAPNLVLTARHCVADPDPAEECAAYGPTRPANGFKIFIGVAVQADGEPAALGERITVPTTSNMCSFDVALIQLDRDVVGARIATVRFSALAPNEPTVAVGYGVDGQDQPPAARMQRSTTVLGVGPTTVAYTARDGTTVRYAAPNGDVVTGESTCYGDSGGPLLDSLGQVVAVTSRGLESLFPAGDPAHGNGCIDDPAVFAGVRFNEEVIRRAAAAAGHALPGEGYP